MYKYYDVKCEKCGNITEQFVENEKFEKCCLCGGSVKRTFTTFNFKLKYDNKKDTVGWADTGYASSKYYDEIKNKG